MGGNYFRPLNRVFLNLSGGTVTGDTLFTQSISASTFYSGSTSLEDLFAPINIVTTIVQSGLNTYTAGTLVFPSVNVSGLTIDNINVSGTSNFNTLSATTFSGETIISGGTNLETVILSLVSTTETFVQPGINTYTGGTISRPIVNVSGLTIDNINVSGESNFTTLSANSLSAGTYYSASTSLESIFQNISNSNTTFIQPGYNIITGGTVFRPIINIVGSPIFSGTVSATGFTDSSIASGEVIFSGPDGRYSGDTNFIFNSITSALTLYTKAVVVSDDILDGGDF